MWTDGQGDTHNEYNNRFYQFLELTSTVITCIGFTGT
jgi:hypothetical protein